MSNNKNSATVRSTPPQEQEAQAEVLRDIQAVPSTLWKMGSILGTGGQGGAVVYRSAVAYKLYNKAPMNSSELRIIRELQERPLPGLVTPFLVTLDPNGKVNGVVMPCLTCSLQDLLTKQAEPPLNHRITSAFSWSKKPTQDGGGDNSSCNSSPISPQPKNFPPPTQQPLTPGLSINSGDNNSFTTATIGMGKEISTLGAIPTRTADDDKDCLLKTHAIFRPVESLRVLGCIVYQILIGLCGLKHELPHEVNGKKYTGFSHNDLRLDNVLIDAQSGEIMLCDYELAGHYEEAVVEENSGGSDDSPKATARTRYFNRSLCKKDKTLNAAYTPAAGSMSEKSDEWCLGLLVLELFTGVQPLLDHQLLNDDFAYDPEALNDGFDWDRESKHDKENFIPLRDHVHKKIRSLYFLQRYGGPSGNLKPTAATPVATGGKGQNHSPVGGAADRHVDPLQPAATPALNAAMEEMNLGPNAREPTNNGEEGEEVVYSSPNAPNPPAPNAATSEGDGGGSNTSDPPPTTKPSTSTNSEGCDEIAANITVNSSSSENMLMPPRSGSTTNVYGLLGTPVTNPGKLSRTATPLGHKHNTLEMAEEFDDFLKKALNRKSSERVEMMELLDHPWLYMSTTRGASGRSCHPTPSHREMLPKATRSQRFPVIQPGIQLERNAAVQQQIVAKGVVSKWIKDNYKASDLEVPRTPNDHQ